MPTNFPASDDVFGIPSDPVNTPLGDPGDSSRSHAENHNDLGDAVEAMQAQATLLVHSHDGITARHGGKLAQANTHQSPDTDSSTSALHHTLGAGANQAAAGTHTHDIVAAYPVGSFFFSIVSTSPDLLGFPGVWGSVGQRFLCATGGSLGFSGGATGGSASHTHTADASTNTVSDHTHTISSSTTSSSGAHTHTGGGTSSNGASHKHTLNSFNAGTNGEASGSGATSIATGSSGHTHLSASASASHSHTTPTVDSSGGHTHELLSTTTGSAGGHSHTIPSMDVAQSLVPFLVVYMWKRTS